jgi:hypothetical protein
MNEMGKEFGTFDHTRSGAREIGIGVDSVDAPVPNCRKVAPALIG